jgi:hypothetical protein
MSFLLIKTGSMYSILKINHKFEYEFIYDYQVIKEHRKELNEKIIQYFYHPKRMSKWFDNIDEFIQIYG